MNRNQRPNNRARQANDQDQQVFQTELEKQLNSLEQSILDGSNLQVSIFRSISNEKRFNKQFFLRIYHFILKQ